jgi:hypothetical protein
MGQFSYLGWKYQPMFFPGYFIDGVYYHHVPAGDFSFFCMKSDVFAFAEVNADKKRLLKAPI